VLYFASRRTHLVSTKSWICQHQVAEVYNLISEGMLATRDITFSRSSILLVLFISNSYLCSWEVWGRGVRTSQATETNQTSFLLENAFQTYMQGGTWSVGPAAVSKTFWSTVLIIPSAVSCCVQIVVINSIVRAWQSLITASDIGMENAPVFSDVQ